MAQDQGETKPSGSGAARDLASFDAPVEVSPSLRPGEAAWRGLVAMADRMLSALGVTARGEAAARRRAAAALAAVARARHVSGRPTVLVVSHDWGGGVERHLRERMRTLSASTDFLMLTPRGQKAELSVPGDARVRLAFGAGDFAEVLAVLRQFPLAEAHVHHVIGFGFDVEPLVRGLGVPFDFTGHDYFALCPRINMVTPWDMRFCGEAPEEACNRCLASGAEPAGGRGDIAAFRARHSWLFTRARRVICPSEDVRLRLARYGIVERVVTVPHEPPRVALLGPRRRLGPGEPLRVVLLGSLMPHKGLWLVRDTVLAARGRNIAFRLIGASTPKLGLPAGAAFAETGAYREDDLASLIAASGADVIWLPSVAPETYSYTLSAALAAGRPIVASDRGAFRERLAGVGWCWLAPPEATPEEMLALFATVAERLSGKDSVRTD